MSYNLRNRHFLALRDFTPQEISFLLKLSADLKAAKYAGTEVPRLTGKEIAPASALRWRPTIRARM